MNPVVSLDDHRPKSAITESLRCRRCGGEWFRLDGTHSGPDVPDGGAVTMTHDGAITGYAGMPVCLGCGEPV
jgi:hypothetical protein